MNIMTMNKSPILLGLCIFLTVLSIQAEESILRVENKSELISAIAKLKHGTTLELAAGKWDSVEINITAKGTAEAPIEIRGSADGKTILTGRSWVGMGGQYITLQDLYFLEVEPPESKSAIVEFRDSNKRAGKNNRISDCVFESCNPKNLDRRYMWVRLYGLENRVDHNLFANQRHSGVTVQVRMEQSDARHRIDHNHFIDRVEGNGNGFEIIQIGQSADSLKQGNCLIDSNLFERCDGETEIISNKTCSNIYRANLFIESAGTLTLRHGDNCIVEGNVFIGKGKESSGGIRVIGSGHEIRDNYFEGIYGQTGGVIVLYAGIPDSPLNGYFAADNSLIDNNILINCEGTALCLDGGYGERGRSILPEGVKISKNLIHSTSSSVIDTYSGSLANVDFIENITTIKPHQTRKYPNGIALKELTLERGASGLFDATYLDGSSAFQYSQSTPELLGRGDIGPSWYVALPPLVVLNPSQVSRVVRGDIVGLSLLLEAVIDEAEEIVAQKTVYSVATNDKVPPSGDLRSYYSTGPYWWRNPETSDGLPYIRRDGEFNPERDLVSDRPALHAMISDVWALTIAYQATGFEDYALFAQRLIHFWFLDKSTGMLPDLNHAQAIPGITEGRGTGIIDTLVFVELVDALRLLENSYTWPLSEQAAVKAWFDKFLNWLSIHPNGIDERMAKNNHGTAYDLQQLAIANYLGKHDLAVQIIERVKTERIPKQITPEGLQPLEFARTRSWSYCTENMEHFSRIAVIARKYGENLFDYRSENSASLLSAINYLLPHACNPKATWKGEQVTEWQSEYIYATASILSRFIESDAFSQTIDCIPMPHDALLSKLMK